MGRGGAGNERLASSAAPAAGAGGTNGEPAGLGDTPLGLADKLKLKIFGVFRK